MIPWKLAASYEGILTALFVSEAIDACSAGRYANAAALYRKALNTRAGNQLRVYNGLYLTSWKLGQRDEAAEAFGRLVDFSLGNNRLAMKLLFLPGSATLVNGPDTPYDLWLNKIATRVAHRDTCLEIVGHTSKSGTPQLNERLSLARRVRQSATGD